MNNNTSKPKSVIKIKLKKIKELLWNLHSKCFFGENEVKKKTNIREGLNLFFKKIA